MTLIAALIYNFIFYPVFLFFAVLGFFVNDKIRTGFKGRLQSIITLKEFRKNLNKNDLSYWFHAASFGEYEQMRPVLAGLKEIEPHAKIVVSFFSPSGFNNVHDNHIDCKIYLPFDFPWTVRKALKLVKPKKLIFAAYDIWPNFVWTAKKQHIHSTLFAARFVKGTKKLKPVIRYFYQSVYDSFHSIYTVDKGDYFQVKKLVNGSQKPILKVLGNPRYDQVKIQSDAFTVAHTQSVLERERCIIAGSIHDEDEPIIFDAMIKILQKYPNVSLLWIPHDPHEKMMKRAESSFAKEGLTWKRLGKNTVQLPKVRVVLVDVVGILSRLYWHGQIAYIGGGFSTGVHNTMEPAIARLPVLFGPKNEEFHATAELLKNGGGFLVRNTENVFDILDKLLSDDNRILKASYAATEVIHRNLGSATRVVRGIIRD